MQALPDEPDAPRTLSMAYVRVLFAHLRLIGLDPARVFNAPLLSRMDFDDASARCTLQDWHELTAAVSQLSSPSDLAPVLAKAFKPWHGGVVGFAVMTCDSVLNIGRTLKHFHPLINDVYSLDRGFEGNRFFLRLHPATATTSDNVARVSLCAWVVILRWLTASPDLCLDGCFSGPAPSNVDDYKRIFGGSVRFEQTHNTLWGQASVVNLAVISGDATSHALLQQRAQDQLTQFHHGVDRLVRKIECLLRARLDAGDVTLESLAGELNVTPRTLQRRLDCRGLSFRQLVDGVRKTRAQYSLRETDLPLMHIATETGFANYGSFLRAFKRWTGLSPNEFRRAHALALPGTQVPNSVQQHARRSGKPQGGEPEAGAEGAWIDASGYDAKQVPL